MTASNYRTKIAFCEQGQLCYRRYEPWHWVGSQIVDVYELLPPFFCFSLSAASFSQRTMAALFSSRLRLLEVAVSTSCLMPALLVLAIASLTSFLA